MIVGIDRSFKPIWVYKILQKCVPNVEYSTIEDEILDVVEYKGVRSKINVVKVLKRYYLYLEKREGTGNKLWTSENYLHYLSKDLFLVFATEGFFGKGFSITHGSYMPEECIVPVIILE